MIRGPAFSRHSCGSRNPSWFAVKTPVARPVSCPPARKTLKFAPCLSDKSIKREKKKREGGEAWDSNGTSVSVKGVETGKTIYPGKDAGEAAERKVRASIKNQGG
jgi:hypothetical protein